MALKLSNIAPFKKSRAVMAIYVNESESSHFILLENGLIMTL